MVRVAETVLETAQEASRREGLVGADGPKLASAARSRCRCRGACARVVEETAAAGREAVKRELTGNGNTRPPKPRTERRGPQISQLLAPDAPAPDPERADVRGPGKGGWPAAPICARPLGLKLRLAEGNHRSGGLRAATDVRGAVAACLSFSWTGPPSALGTPSYRRCGAHPVRVVRRICYLQTHCMSSLPEMKAGRRTGWNAGYDNRSVYGAHHGSCSARRLGGELQ